MKANIYLNGELVKEGIPVSKEVEKIIKEKTNNIKCFINDTIKHIQEKYLVDIDVFYGLGAIPHNIVLSSNGHCINLEVSELLRLNNLNKEKYYYRLDSVIERLLVKTFLRGEK